MQVSPIHRQVSIESFEERRTVDYAVESLYGEEHPLTQEIKDANRRNYDYRSGEFTPELLEGKDARLVMGALKKLAQHKCHRNSEGLVESKEDAFALTAAEILGDRKLKIFGSLGEVAVPDVVTYRDPPVREKALTPATL